MKQLQLLGLGTVWEAASMPGHLCHSPRGHVHRVQPPPAYTFSWAQALGVAWKAWVRGLPRCSLRCPQLSPTHRVAAPSAPSPRVTCSHLTPRLASLCQAGTAGYLPALSRCSHRRLAQPVSAHSTALSHVDTETI